MNFRSFLIWTPVSHFPPNFQNTLFLEIESERRIIDTEWTPARELPILNRATSRDPPGIELTPKLPIPNQLGTLNSPSNLTDLSKIISAPVSLYLSLSLTEIQKLAEQDARVLQQKRGETNERTPWEMAARGQREGREGVSNFHPTSWWVAFVLIFYRMPVNLLSQLETSPQDGGRHQWLGETWSYVARANNETRENWKDTEHACR